MLRLPRFRLLVADSPSEAAVAKAEYGPRAVYVAGGTDLFPKMKRRQELPELVISLERGALGRGILPTGDGGLRIDAGVRLTELAGDPRVRDGWPALAEAAAGVATAAIRNRATLGGNLCLDTRCSFYDQSLEWRRAIDFCLKKDGESCRVAGSSQRCWAIQASDASAAMIALDATFELIGPEGMRRVAAEDFYADDGIQYLRKRPEELLTAVELPPAGDRRSVHLKVSRRRSFDFPLLTVTATVGRATPDAGVESARIVVGAVGSAPILATEAAELLVGRPLTLDAIEAAADAASRRARPLDNADESGLWRKRMIRPHVVRALRQLAGLDVDALGGRP